MDPLSITAGILSSIAAVNKGLNIIVSLVNAPSEFLDLQNELETVQGYLTVLAPLLVVPEKTLKSSVAPTQSLTRKHVLETSHLLEQDVAALRRITEEIRADSNAVRKDGRPRISVFRWRRKSGTISHYREKIRRRRLELAEALSLAQAVQSQSNSNLILDVQKITRVEMAALGGLISKSTEIVQSSIDSLSRPSNPVATDIKLREPTPASLKRTKNDLIRIETSVRQQCPPSCPCQCHHIHQLHTDRNSILSQKIFGQLFLSYNGIPSWNRPACDTQRCRYGADMSVRLVYLFPTWLYGKALDFYLSWKSVTGQGASLHLRMPRAIRNTDDVFWAILENKLDVVQSRLSSREVLPTDVDDELGMSLLTYSLTRNNGAEVAEFLLPLTHDLFAVDVQGRSPYYYARAILYSNSSNDPAQAVVSRRILDRCADEAGGDTLLHQTLFGETPLSLSDALALDPTAINVPDRNGYTPLHWACVRADLPAINLLLAAGADVAARDFLGRTPLFVAIQRCRVALLEPLLAAGADINTQNKTGTTPLFEAVRQNANLVFEFLLRRGAVAPPRKSDGVSILHCLAPYERDADSARMADLMLDAGYDLNARCRRGWTPLMYSLWYDDAAGVAAMLLRGADVAGVADPQGRTVLHFAALHCSRAALEALDGWVDGVGREARDSKGVTAEEYFSERRESSRKGSRPVTDKDDAAFRRLIAGIRAFERRDSGFDEPSSDGDSDCEEEVEDAFHDAVEVL